MTTLTARLVPVALIIAIVCLSSCERGDKTIVLKYKYTPGLQLVYQQDMQRQVRITAGDSVVENSSNTFLVKVTQAVDEVREDSTAIIRELDQWTYTRPSKEDSTRLDTVQMDRTMLLTVKPDGDILDVKFVDEQNESAKSYIKNFMEQGMPVFPSGEVSPGFSWTQSAKVIMPDQTMEASSTYKVVALVREAGYDCALIEVDGNLIIPIEPNPADTVIRTGVERIRTTGKMYFAYKEGIVVSQHERWVVDGDHRRIKKGDTTDFKMMVQSDVDYVLAERTVKQ